MKPEGNDMPDPKSTLLASRRRFVGVTAATIAATSLSRVAFAQPT